MAITLKIYKDYQKRREEQLLLSLQPMWQIIELLDREYKQALNLGSPGSCHPLSDEAFSWFNTFNRKSTSLNAIGLALIHIADTFIKSLLTDHQNSLRLSDLPPWANVIVAAGNFCRHGDEWYEIVKEDIQANFYNRSTKFTSYSNTDFDTKIVPLYQTKLKNKDRVSSNLTALLKYGILSNKLITPSPDYYDISRQLKLHNKQKLLKSLHEINASCLAKSIESEFINEPSDD